MRIVIGLLILSGVILFHELGHFLLAKASHICVNEFALGMGPRILSFKRGETLYALRLFPIGGLCAMKGEDAEDQSEGSFQRAKVWQRILVVAAGPVFNFILAFLIALIVIFSIGADPCRVTMVQENSPAWEAGLREGDLITGYEGHGVSNARELSMYLMLDGLPTDEISLDFERDGKRHSISYTPEVTESYLTGFNYSGKDEQVVITGLIEGYPMEAAGLQVGDVIVGIDGVSLPTTEEFVAYMEEHPLDGSPVEVIFERNEIPHTVTVTPKVSREANGGFAFNMAREKQGFFSSIGYSFGEIKYWINTTIKTIASLFTGRFGIQDLSGPVGVVDTIGKVYDEAKADGLFNLVMTMLNMVILLSANLGVMNLLPLPALDGGRLIFLFIECIRRKPCNQKIEGMVHLVGIVALLGLAAYVAVNDVIKLF